MYRILLIDDEPMIKIGIRKLLKDTDYIIAGTANNGMEALSFLNVEPVDIILTDLKMPVMNGIELLQHLKAIHFEGITLALSNYSDFELVRQALTEGAVDYLLKTDITRQKLLEYLDRVSQTLKKKNTQRLENARREEQNQQNQRRLYLHEWKEYFQNETLPSKEAQRLLFSSKEDTLTLVLIRYHKSALSDTQQKRIVSQLLTILPDIFTGSREVVYVKPEPLTLLCLISSSSRQNPDLETQQIIRRSRMYLNAAPIIAYDTGLSSTEDTLASYHAAVNALEYFYYYPEKEIFPCSQYPALVPADSRFLHGFSQDIKACMEKEEPEGLAPVIWGYLGICQEKHFLPRPLMEACCQSLEHLLPKISPEGSGEASLHQLCNCSSLRDFFQNLLDFLMEAASGASHKAHPPKKEIQSVLAYLYSHYCGHFSWKILRPR